MDRLFRYRDRVCILLLLPVLFSLLTVPVGAIGYDAATARAGSANGDPVVDILTFDPQQETSINKEVWYGIYNAEGLCRFSTLVNTTNSTFLSQEVRVCLCNSIDMAGVDGFSPIGNGISKFTADLPSNSFSGTFDGRGYVIDNLTVTPCFHEKREIAYASLFGSVGRRAVIRNLVIGSGCIFSYTGDLQDGCVASLAARVEEGALIEQILNLASVGGGSACGGLVARVQGAPGRNANHAPALIRNCTSRGSVGSSNIAGGLVGRVSGNLEMSGCIFEGELTGTSAGGAVGAAEPSDAKDWNSDSVSLSLSEIRAMGTALIGHTGSDVTVTETDCRITGSEELPLQPVEERVGVRFHGVQLAEEENSVSIRMVASVDAETVYTGIGFALSNGVSEPRDFSCTVLFTSLLGQSEGEEIVYTANELRGDNGYLFAAILRGAKLALGDSVTLTLSAYAQAGGERSETGTYTFTLTKTEGGYTVTWNN